ncbi:MAG: XrtA/PEP-CTERM system TPR-repeat protein PrsT, partial [Halopseudomonas sp.]
ATIGIKQKDYAKAVDHAEATLAQAENHLESLYIAAMANYHQNRFEKAYKQIDKLLVHVPDHNQSLKLKAALELKLGLKDEATTTFSQLNDEAFELNDAELLVAAGIASLQTGDYEQSKRLFRQASSLNSDDPRIHLGQASIALHQGDSDTAIAELLQATKKAPESQNTTIALIMSYLQNQQPELAIKTAQQFSQAYPQSPHGPMLKGLAYVMKRDFNNAEIAFERALSIEPGNPSASYSLATLAEGQKDIAKARSLHMNVVKYHPEDLNSLLKLFYFDLQADKHQQAMGWLKQAVETNPDVLHPKLMLAQLYLRWNQPLQALAICEQALPSYPNNPDLLLLVGDAQRLSGQQAQAIYSFQKLSQLAPDQLLPQYRLATLYKQTGQLADASKAVNRALSINPEHLGALLLKGQIALKSGNTKQASNIVQRLEQSVAGNSFITELQAQIAFANQRPAEAVKLYREVLSQRETNEITIQLAYAQWQQPKRQEAIDTLVQWISRYPDDLLTLNVLANFYLFEGQWDNARRQFEHIVALMPGNALALNNLAWLLLQEGHVDKALLHAQQARQLAPNNPEVLDTLGTVLLEKNNYPAAEQIFADAAALLPKDLEIQLHLAQASAKVGKKEHAEQLLTKILSTENSQTPFASREAAEHLLNQLRQTTTPGN